jgi:signal transduction histidine kinase
MAGKLERLCLALQRSADEQRRGAARRLHDSSSQALSAASMRLSLLEHELEPLPAAARAALAEAQALISDSVRELSELSRALHPPLLGEGGLPGALRGLAQRLGEGRVRLALAPLPPLAPVGELAIYRLLEETLAATAPVFAAQAAVSARVGAAGASASATLAGPPAGDGSDPAFALVVQSLQQRFRALGGRLRVRRTAALLVLDAAAPAREEANGP